MVAWPREAGGGGERGEGLAAPAPRSAPARRVLAVGPANRQPAWQQVADAIGNAVRSGMRAAGDPLPSVREKRALQDVPVATLQHALGVLAEEGLILVRQGRTANVA